MRRMLLPLLLLVAGTLGASESGTTDIALVEDETTFYVNWHECGAASSYALETDAAPENGCGPAGGIPLGEAFALAEEPYIQTYSTKANDGVPLTLDVSRTLDGEIHIHSWSGLTGAGVGNVVVNGRLQATVLKEGATKPTNVVLGTFTGEGVATPQAESVAIPFALELDDALAGGEVRSMSLALEVRGVFVDSGVQTNAGKSLLVVPTLVDPEPQA